ncbi:MAG: 23S rRNA (pseudouridine(1915)-N(3))-methyltransferase RlmH [Coriobacteriia bacterium]|nr:23S rRNA (pseudouridine(1915)-N(3))-methyltransferase RlmH [Coriobacteriia bacterium]
MKITIIAVGKLKERFWREAVAEYMKRLQSYADVRIIEIADRDSDKLSDDRVLEQEGADIIRAIPSGSHVVLLAIEGKLLSSPGLAERIAELGLHGTSSVTFIVGGSLGVCSAVRSAVQESVSFGAITLPHNLARVVLVEQVYRAFRINRGEPYHK